MSQQFPKVSIASENSVIVYFSDRPCSQTSSIIAHTAGQLKKTLSNCLIDLVPSYHSLLVIYNAIDVNYVEIEQAIFSSIGGDLSMVELATGRRIELPLYYSLESGPDLKRLAARAKLSIAEVISIHQQTEYTVFAMGFSPGFAYLGEVDPRISAPRLDTPRQQVAKGSVGIADRQTAIYPAQSPGGWNIIGLCPAPMFDLNKQPSTLVKPGDTVCFKAIDRMQFIQLGGLEVDLTGTDQ